MEMQTQATGTTPRGIVRELLMVLLHALASGLAAAVLAGLVVVVLTIIAE